MVVFYDIPQDEVKSYLNFHLSIELTSNSVSLLLVDKKNQKPVAIENISLKDISLDLALNKSEIVSETTPNSVSCGIVNSIFTLVPVPLFSDNNKEEYLSFSSESSSDYTVLADKHLKNEVITCFGIENKIQKTVLSFFPLATFKHNSSVLSDSLSSGFHVNFVGTNEFEAIIIKDKKLLFYNYYSCDGNEEIMYYLTLIAEKHSINLTETSMKFSGVVEKKGETISYISQFIPSENLTFNEIETSQLNAVSTHRYFTLHKQFSCVS